MRAGGDGSGGSGGRGGGVRSLLTSAAPSSTKIGSSTRFAITISAPINSSASAQSHALQLEHLSLFLRCLPTRLRLLSCSTSSLSSSSELSSSPSPSLSCVGTVLKRFSPRSRFLPIIDQTTLGDEVWLRWRALASERAPRWHSREFIKINPHDLRNRYLSPEQTTVRKPDHSAAGVGSTGQSKQRAGSGHRGGLVIAALKVDGLRGGAGAPTDAGSKRPTC